MVSDRGISRSYRTMGDFGIHTFCLINAEGKATSVCFHWEPLTGGTLLVWDEAQKLTGHDPDFHCRELWKTIKTGGFPRYELSSQLISEEDELKFGFNLPDPTKFIPKGLAPVQYVGRMVLNRNLDNFFAENEQVTSHLRHIVSGLDFTNDPLLQGCLFSYTDTQVSRLSGPNFHEAPTSHPICSYHNFQHDGMHRMGADINPASYKPNSINDNQLRETPPGPKRGGFESYQECVEGNKVRECSPSFDECYSHLRLFWLDQTPFEQHRVVDGFGFELSKVIRPYICECVVGQPAYIDLTLAQTVAEDPGIELTDNQLSITPPLNVNGLKRDPSLGLYVIPDGDVKGRVVAILLNDGMRSAGLLTILKALKTKGVHVKLFYSRMGGVAADDGTVLPIATTFTGAPSSTVDVVVVPCDNIMDTVSNGGVSYYLIEAYKHLKPITLTGDVREFRAAIKVVDQGKEEIAEAGSVNGSFIGELLTLMAAHRMQSRIPKINKIPV